MCALALEVFFFLLSEINFIFCFEQFSFISAENHVLFCFVLKPALPQTMTPDLRLNSLLRGNAMTPCSESQPNMSLAPSNRLLAALGHETLLHAIFSGSMQQLDMNLISFSSGTGRFFFSSKHLVCLNLSPPKGA